MLTAVMQPARFGTLNIEKSGEISSFREKRAEDGNWINGGFMILEPDIFDYIAGDDTFFEHEPLNTLAAERELAAFQHEGFWQCMDTQRDREKLEELWASGNAPWKLW